MTDIVEALRDRQSIPGHGTCQDCYDTIMDEAADRIEAITAALASLLELHGKPHREEWLNDKAWENAIIVTERARQLLTRTKTPS